MKKSFTYLTLAALLVVAMAASALGQGSEEIDEVLLWYPYTISFDGPVSSENADPNPFTDYRLLVTFEHQEATYRIRGYYAADGNAAETGADSGPVWCVRFAPDRPGIWTYSARLSRDEHIAIDDRPDAGEEIDLEHSRGSFRVVTFAGVGGQQRRDIEG